MAIRDYTPPTEEIMHAGKPLMKVRGLSLEDVSRLIRDHMDDINHLVELQQGAKSEIFSRLQTDGFLLKLMTDAPIVLVQAIAAAADERDEESLRAIHSMPISLQIVAMRAIVRLTLEDIGGPKGLAALWKNLKT